MKTSATTKVLAAFNAVNSAIKQLVTAEKELSDITTTADMPEVITPVVLQDVRVQLEESATRASAVMGVLTRAVYSGLSVLAKDVAHQELRGLLGDQADDMDTYFSTTGQLFTFVYTNATTAAQIHELARRSALVAEARPFVSSDDPDGRVVVVRWKNAEG
ncbi:hypothetical protein GCM10029964_092950 [Kibdelosporangium lantanae]